MAWQTAYPNQKPDTQLAATRYPDSGTQPLTALCTTSIDDLTTSLGTHAGTETVGATATNGAGLKGTFHGLSPCVVPDGSPAGEFIKKRRRLLHILDLSQVL